MYFVQTNVFCTLDLQFELPDHNNPALPHKKTPVISDLEGKLKRIGHAMINDNISIYLLCL
jgi:hypothetical protein